MEREERRCWDTSGAARWGHDRAARDATTRTYYCATHSGGHTRYVETETHTHTHLVTCSVCS